MATSFIPTLAKTNMPHGLSLKGFLPQNWWLEHCEPKEMLLCQNGRLGLIWLDLCLKNLGIPNFPYRLLCHSSRETDEFKGVSLEKPTMTPSKKQKKMTVFQVEWTIQNIRQRMRDATWQILMGHWWLEAGLAWAVELFCRPQGASWSIRLQPVIFRCGCTQHALGVPWADSKLVSYHLIARHFSSLHCVTSKSFTTNPTTTSFGRFYPNGLEGSKNGYCGLYVRSVSWC